MHVPEATIDVDDLAKSREYEIGRARKTDGVDLPLPERLTEKKLS